MVGCYDHNYVNPTLYLDARPIVGLFPFCFRAAGCEFKRDLRLHIKEAVHRDYEGGEVAELMEVRPDTSPDNCYGGRGIQCSQHACREYFLYLSARGSGSEGFPSAKNSPSPLVDCLEVTQ